MYSKEVPFPTWSHPDHDRHGAVKSMTHMILDTILCSGVHKGGFSKGGFSN